MGKSLLAHRLAAAAEAAGRAVTVLRWDASRLPFDRADVLARFPEAAGVTHPVIRFAAGAWARDALGRWDREAGPDDLIVGETPLLGNRFAELAQRRDDEVERLLASERTLFVLPVPTREVRARIAGARAEDIATERDRHSAPSHLLGEYDPDAYAARYRRALRHRRVAVLPVTAFGTAERPAVAARDLLPTASEVDRYVAMFAERPRAELEGLAERWDEG
ncbi:MAG: hypothetical protein FJ028_03405 [Chloroflexi bacterium]|nr:hypothetical protein [Chloroflexota bacterium]